jgi:hypothetical protein
MGDSAAAERALAMKGVQAITTDRAKDVIKIRQREKAMYDKWVSQNIKVSKLSSHAVSAHP